ncbi:MAG: hypothetical protein AB8H79_01230 [Myxococcota bacterium]
MARLASWSVWAMLLAGSGCGVGSTAMISDPVVVDLPELSVQVDTPRSWTVRHEPQHNRSLFFLGAEGDRDHAVIVQRLPKTRTYRAHAERFRQGQEHALDKITGESDRAELGVRFETRRSVAKKPDIRKLIYYRDMQGSPFLVDLSAPEPDFNAALFDAVAKTLRPVD